MERYLTVEETARALRVTADTVRRWLRTGRLHGVKIGHAYRVPERALATPVAPRTDPSASVANDWDPEENRRKMERALALLDALGPSIQAGIQQPFDISGEMDAMREERAKELSGE